MLILNILISIAAYCGNYLYMTEGGLLLKGLASGCFALMGLINLIYALIRKEKNKGFYIFISAGLMLSMLGDIALNVDFVAGAALFALGHICYFIGQTFLMKIKWQDLTAAGIIIAGAGAFLLFHPLLAFPEPFMKWVCFAYALIISLMVGKAIGNLIRKPCAVTVLYGVGSVLFFFSDLMLVFDWFIGIIKNAGELCMATYFPAQCLLAYGMYQNTKKK